MAVQDSENPSHPGARLSPGDAAFERLRQREALRSRDESASPPSAPASHPAVFVGPPANPATMAATGASAAATAEPPASESESKPPPAPVGVAPAKSATPMPAFSNASGRDHARVPVDPVLAMAAAFGIEPAALASSDAPLAPIETAAAPIPPPVAPDCEPAAAFVAPPAFVTSAEDRAAPPSPSVDATAARLEAALLDQLKSLEETLVEDAPRTPPRLPRAAPLRLATGAPQTPVPEAPPQRSVFAPDPVRQRTYVDLRKPAPVPEADASDNPPWRKYLDERPRRETAGRALSHRPAASPAGRPAPVVAAIHDRKAAVEERGRGIRAMTAAAVLGLGVGLGILVLIRPFVDSGTPSVAASVSGTPAPVVAALPDTQGPATAPRAGSQVNQALATLLTDPPVSRAAPGRPAVISEPGTPPPVPVAASSPEATEPAASPAPPAPVVIRPPPGEARDVARVPDFDAAQSGPLAYGPAIPSYDPVRQQLLEQEAEGEPTAEPRPQVAARAPAGEESAPVRPGRATINGFVNLRAKPDNAAPVVAILAEGLSVKVIACDYWCEIEAGGKRGFVFKRFVSR
jgi:hypothetical protein